MNSIFDLTTINAIRDHLMARQETIAAAESVTSGFVQAALSCATDAAKFFQGGITTYNLGQKSRHLLIEPIHALSCNCVSEQVAREMSLHVCKLFNSDWGIAITGYASPVPESGNKLYACYSIAWQGNVLKTGQVIPAKDEPVHIQLWYTRQLLEQLQSSFTSRSALP